MGVYLVRHAETDSNATRIVQLPDAALSERGLAQAARLAARLARAGVAAILSSDLRRAAATAEAVRAATGAPLTYDPELRERNYGALRGIAYAAIAADIFAPDFEPPEGETWAAFHERVDAAWGRVSARAATTHGNLVVVTHGLVLRAVVERHLQLSPGLTVGLTRANTAVTIVEGAPPRLVRVLDCASHLDSSADGAPV